MKRYTAREIALMSEEQIWALPNLDEYEVEFDDKVIVADVRRLQMCWYFWWPLRDLGPDVAINSKHYLGSGCWDSKSALKLADSMWWDVFESRGRSINPEIGAMRIKQQVNELYNSTSAKLGAYVGSLDILDFYEIISHPPIKAINDRLQALDVTNKSVLVSLDREIAEAQSAVRKILMTDPALENNRLVAAVRAKISDINPVLQIVCCRGKVTDMDSNIFFRGIVRGFAHGLFSLYDTMVESRTAAKALALQKDPLAATEYFNRQMQLICATLSQLDAFWQYNVEGTYKLHDCGTKRHVVWQVDKNNLGDIAGMYRIDDDGSLKSIRNDSYELIGHVVKLRTAMTCGHKKHGHICAACLGDTEFSIPAGTNLAHVAAIVLCAIISQKVLSVKHNEHSAVQDMIIIPPSATPFIRVMDTMDSYGLSFKLDTETSHIIIRRADGMRLNDVNETDDIDALTLRRVAVMQEVRFATKTPQGDEMLDFVHVNSGTTGSAFSYEFLKHIRNVGFTMDEENVTIPLKGWDSNLPVWVMSRKHSNMLDLMESVKQMVKVADDTKRERLSMDLGETNNVSRALANFYDLVKSKFDFSVSLLSVIMRATMVVSKENNDYHIPSGDQLGEFAEYSKTMELRSIALAVPHERHKDLYTSPLSYTIRNRPPSPADEILKPTHSYVP